MGENLGLLRGNNGSPRRVDVKLFLYENRKWLCTRRFPAYAHEFNPDERIWNVLKYQGLSNRCPDTIGEMKARVKSVMSRLKRHPERLRNAIANSRLPLPSIRARPQ